MRKILVLIAIISATSLFCSKAKKVTPTGLPSSKPLPTIPTLPGIVSMTVPEPERTTPTDSNERYISIFGTYSDWFKVAKDSINIALSLYKNATLVSPVVNADTTGWIWNLTNSEGYTGVLTGIAVTSDSATWSMNITGGNIVNSNSLTGTSYNGGLSGQWIFKKHNIAGIKYVIDYVITDPATQVEITFTNYQEYDADFDLYSYLQYTLNSDKKTLVMKRILQRELYTIEWSASTGAGYIKSNWITTPAYWDTKLNGYKNL